MRWHFELEFHTCVRLSERQYCPLFLCKKLFSYKMQLSHMVLIRAMMHAFFFLFMIKVKKVKRKYVGHSFRGIKLTLSSLAREISGS